MSMYNILFGRNPHAKTLLAMLELTEGDIGRFRDAFVANDKIAIYTRLGGGNRECWCEKGEEHDCFQAHIQRLQNHPNYLSDEDDDFDCTYATFYFDFPEKYREILEAMDTGKQVSRDERWTNKLKELEEMSPEELERKFPQLVDVVRRITEQICE